EALILEQQLVADFPTVPEYRQFLANHHGNLARLLADSGRAQEAEDAYQAALKLSQQLAANFPSVPEYRHALAASHNDLGILLQSTGRALDAERAYRE